jgi:hypothetical protein
MNDIQFQSAVLLRKCPDPVPEVFPLPEYLAKGDRKEDYEDTKAVFEVPWMGVIAMAFSHYRKFYRALWLGLRPVFQSAGQCQGKRQRSSFPHFVKLRGPLDGRRSPRLPRVFLKD